MSGGIKVKMNETPGFIAFAFFERRGDAAEGRGFLDSEDISLSAVAHDH